MKQSGLARHAEIMRKMHGRTVEAGWFETARYDDGTPVAQVAEWNEFGHAGNGRLGPTPARPFMRMASLRIKNSIGPFQIKLALGVLNKTITIDQALGQIGLLMESRIVDSIKNGGWPSNSDITINGTKPNKDGTQWIKGKGFDKPLIDSSTMWQTVASKYY